MLTINWSGLEKALLLGPLPHDVEKPKTSAPARTPSVFFHKLETRYEKPCPLKAFA